LPVLEAHPRLPTSDSVRVRRSGLLTIDIARRGGRSKLILRGELDRSTLSALESEVGLLEPARDLLVDLSGLEFMDSSAVHALLQAQTAVSEAGATLHLIAGSRRVQSVFRLTDTERMFTFVTGAPFEFGAPRPG
jgi:anti-anti-sigma factor